MISKLLTHTLIVSMFMSSSGLSSLALAASHETPAHASETRDDLGDENTASGSQTLAPGYLMLLSSEQDSNLNGAFRIQFDSQVNLPYSKTLNTKGLTLEQFRVEIDRIYRPYFTGNVSVKASIKQKRYYVDVRGRVAHPGIFLVKRDTPLDEIIALAGGLTENLTTGFVRIEQGVNEIHWVDMTEYFKRGESSDVPLWVGGDRIFFQKEGPSGSAAAGLGEFSQKVQVMGEVKNPGELTYKPNADAYYYLVKAGGPTSNVDYDKVQVVRTDPKTGEHKPIQLGNLDEVKSVKDGDILLFHPSRPSSTDRTLQTTAIIAGILSTILLGVVAVRGLQK